MAQKVKVWNATPSYISLNEGIVRPAETLIVVEDHKVKQMVDDKRLFIVETFAEETEAKKTKKKTQVEEIIAPVTEVTEEITSETTAESIPENNDLPEEEILPVEG